MSDIELNTKLYQSQPTSMNYDELTHQLAMVVEHAHRAGVSLEAMDYEERRTWIWENVTRKWALDDYDPPPHTCHTDVTWRRGWEQ